MWQPATREQGRRVIPPSAPGGSSLWWTMGGIPTSARTGVDESQPAGQEISQIRDTCAWLRELHGSQLTPGVGNINSVLECGGLVVLVVMDVERELEVEEVKWKVQVAEVEVEGGVREGEEGRLLCGWIGRRKKEVGCVPEPLNVREPFPCIDPRLPDYPVPA